MKTLRSSIIVLSLTTAAAVGVLAADSAPPAKAPAAKATAAQDLDSVPKSTFIIPTTAGAAHDPFYPNRLIQEVGEVKAQATTNARPSLAGCLVLKGLSGVEPNPLAMINGRTMGRGEDAEIVTDCGRLLVHCVDITTNSAIVEVGGERRELHLRSDL